MSNIIKELSQFLSYTKYFQLIITHNVKYIAI